MTNKEKNFVSAVVYVHNAGSRIERFLQNLIAVLEENFEHSEIICVNDFSEDDSDVRIRSICETAQTTSVSMINMSCFHGMELAMNAGVGLSIGDFVYEFDNTDADYDASVIMAVYRRSLEGYDIVSASPDKREKTESRLFYGLFKHYSKTSSRMTTESFRILSRRAINRTSAMNNTVIYRKAVYMSCGLKTDNIKYHVSSKGCGGLDKDEKEYRRGLAVDVLIMFTDVGYRLSKAMTQIMMVISVIMIIYSVVIYMTSNPVAGWTTTILFLSIAFLGLFAVLTVIIKYLQLIVDLVFRRMHYNFESIEKITK
jgi:dolichol-phosphate mannosyltransferase